MEKLNKDELMNKTICVILIILIVLSAVYIFKVYASKREAQKERDLLNSVDMEENIDVTNENMDSISREAEETKSNENNKDSEKAEKTSEENREKSFERIKKVKKLNKEYNNIIGWVEIENTNISYPVVQGENNNFYLTHNYKGDKAERGAIFLDSNYNWKIKGNNYMLYGHYMINGEMFTDLLKYIEEDFYKEHQTIRFTTMEEDAEYSIIAVFRSKVYNKSDEDVFRYYNFMNSENEKEYNKFIENAKEASLYDIEATAEYGDQLITMSTCSYYVEDGRFVIVGKKSL